MNKIAFVFPGQGSQSVGMLDSLSNHQQVVDSVNVASQVLNKDLRKMIDEGPAEELNQTQWTQPALLAVSVGIFNAVQARSAVPLTCMAGHSLGEYSALVCAGSMPYEAAIELVHKRGLYMQEAVPEGTGSMAAVLSLEADLIESACQQAQQQGLSVVSPANYNSPGQVVIAGTVEAVAKASQLCIDAGAKRVLPLSVSVPSHCELMLPAADKLALDLERINLQEPNVTVLHNADVKSHTEQNDIKSVLKQQLFSPVKWTQTMQAFSDLGIDTVVECGPGKVLSGLFKRFDRKLQVISLSNAKGIETFLGE